MQKVFYVSKNSDRYENRSDNAAPDLDRFQRIEQLNGLLEKGWTIKDFKTDNNDAFFVLEKADK